ncbi:MAG: hypothetical protein L3J79_10630 [Candidatus Marinimicrobia bacterium]|nr:hypothetical protein [Candidatus Neomarinimicrobiota bacterium]
MKAMRRALFPILILCSFLLAGCVSMEIEEAISIEPTASISRSMVLQIAETYRVHEWQPSKGNIFHGKDKDDIRVDTPNIEYTDPGAERPGWWISDKPNTGIPYMWGGFDTPESFDRKLSSGHYAGDIYSSEKRRLLDDGVSTQACGIDCSGFISRCWGLSRSYSTRELPSISKERGSFNKLKPGDIVNKTNEHTLLFVKFIDADHKRFMAYETGSPPSWKVLKHPISVNYVKGLGYRPYRYKNIKD